MKTFFTVLIATISVTGLAAQDATAPKRSFVIYAGVGPNIYFNNLVIAKDYVKEVNYSFAGRIMWEPEHRLSLGIESGYYRLYSMDFGSQSDVNIVNYAIPIQLTISMKVMKQFYCSFSSGQSVLINKVSNTADGNIDASVFSLGDFAAAAGYRHKLRERLTLSAETRFFYSSKLNDKNLALLFLLGYRL